MVKTAFSTVSTSPVDLIHERLSQATAAKVGSVEQELSAKEGDAVPQQGSAIQGTEPQQATPLPDQDIFIASLLADTAPPTTQSVQNVTAAPQVQQAPTESSAPFSFDKWFQEHSPSASLGRTDPARFGQLKEALVPPSVLLEDIQQRITTLADDVAPNISGADVDRNVSLQTFESNVNDVADVIDKTPIRHGKKSNRSSADTWNDLVAIGLAKEPGRIDRDQMKLFMINAASQLNPKTITGQDQATRRAQEQATVDQLLSQATAKKSNSKTLARATIDGSVSLADAAKQYNSKKQTVDTESDTATIAEGADFIPLAQHASLVDGYVAMSAGQPEALDQYSNPRANLSTQQKSDITNVVLDAMQQANQLHPISIERAGQDNSINGFNVTTNFTNGILGIAPYIPVIKDRLTVKVSDTPLQNGQFGTQANFSHKEATKFPIAPGLDTKVDVDKFDVVEEAKDISGKTPFSFTTPMLSFLSTLLTSVNGDVDPVFNYSTDPRSILLGADAHSFFKAVPNENFLFQQWKDHALFVPGNSIPEVPVTMEGRRRLKPAEMKAIFRDTYGVAVQNFTGPTELKEALLDADANGNTDLLDKLTAWRVDPARKIQQDRVRDTVQDIQAILNRGTKPFFVPQTTISPNTRIMIGSTHLNAISSKLVRGMMDNPKRYLVKGVGLYEFSLDSINGFRTDRKAQEGRNTSFKTAEGWKKHFDTLIGPHDGYASATSTQPYSIESSYVISLARSLNGVKLKGGNMTELKTGNFRKEGDSIGHMLDALGDTSTADFSPLVKLARTAYQLEQGATPETVETTANVFNKMVETLFTPGVAVQGSPVKRAMNGLGGFKGIQIPSNITPEAYADLLEAIGIVNNRDGTLIPGSADDSFHRIRGLASLGKMLSGKERKIGGTQTSTNIRTHFDGISNGAGIQGATAGSVPLMMYTGVSFPALYSGLDGSFSSKDSVPIVPGTNKAGDIKDLMNYYMSYEANILSDPDKAIADRIFGNGGQLSAIDLIYKNNHTKRNVMRQILDTIGASNLRTGHKATTMLIAYASSGSAAATEGAKAIESELSVSIPEFNKTVNDIITNNGLNSTFDFWTEFNKVQKTAANMMLSDVIGNTRGVENLSFVTGFTNIPFMTQLPNGRFVSHGINDIVQKTSTISVGDEVRKTPTYSSQYDPFYRVYETKVKGSKQAKQLAVSSTHGVDASIDQMTLVDSYNALTPPELNGTLESFYDTSGDAMRRHSYFSQQIYDAFETDMGSYLTMKKLANKNFYNVTQNKQNDYTVRGRDGYNAQLRVIDNYLTDLRADPNEVMTVSRSSPEWRFFETIAELPHKSAVSSLENGTDPDFMTSLAMSIPKLDKKTKKTLVDAPSNVVISDILKGKVRTKVDKGTSTPAQMTDVDGQLKLENVTGFDVSPNDLRELVNVYLVASGLKPLSESKSVKDLFRITEDTLKERIDILASKGLNLRKDYVVIDKKISANESRRKFIQSISKDVIIDQYSSR